MACRQASCVVIGERAVLIEGPPGTGKSTLCLALIDRGARLVGDDGVLIERIGGALIVRPHPNTRGLIEIRNLGLVPMPVCDEANLGLVIRLDESAPRYIETPETLMLEGVSLPVIRIWPKSPCLPQKVEIALDRFAGQA